MRDSGPDAAASRITLTVLAFFLFGDALRDAVDMRDPADETAELPR